MHTFTLIHSGCQAWSDKITLDNLVSIYDLIILRPGSFRQIYNSHELIVFAARHNPLNTRRLGDARDIATIMSRDQDKLIIAIFKFHMTAKD